MWLNRFVVQPGGEIITSIDIVYANTLANQPTEVVLWSDPTKMVTQAMPKWSR